MGRGWVLHIPVPPPPPLFLNRMVYNIEILYYACKFIFYYSLSQLIVPSPFLNKISSLTLIYFYPEIHIFITQIYNGKFWYILFIQKYLGHLAHFFYVIIWIIFSLFLKHDKLERAVQRRNHGIFLNIIFNEHRLNPEVHCIYK